jgi:hypothetical protein
MANKNQFNFVAGMSYNNLLSDLTFTLRSYIESVLPKRYIKYFTVENSTNAIEKDEENPTSTSEVKRIRRPQLNINPSYQIINVEQQEEIAGLMPLMHPFGGVFKQDIAHMRGIFANDEIFQSILYERKRLRTAFSLSITVESPLQVMNLKRLLDTRLYPGNKHFINNINLLVSIPPVILKTIAVDMNIDTTTTVGMQLLIDHLNKSSRSRIIHKITQSTGKSSVCFLMSVNLLVLFSDIDTEMNRKNNSNADCKVNFSVDMSFVYPEYFAATTHSLPAEVDVTEEFEEYETLIFSGYIESEIRQNIGDKQIRLRQEFQTEVNQSYDQLNIASILPQDIAVFINRNKTNPTYLDSKLIFKLYDHSFNELVYGSDFDFNFNTLTININESVVNESLILLVYADNRELFAIQEELNGVRIDSVEDKLVV